MVSSDRQFKELSTDAKFAVVKVHKNNYVSFCYRIFGNTTVKTMAEIILKCYCWHTKLTCFIGIAMKLTCYYQHT